MARKRDEGTRAPNLSSTIYQGADGYWHGRVTVGVRDDGRPDRRHVMGRREADVRRKVRDLERARDSGAVPRAGASWTVAQWLTHWVQTIAAPPTVRDTTHAGYQVAIRVHLIPGVGAHRLDRLQPEHLERLYQAMLGRGSKPATAHQVHRTVRTALGEAVRRGYLVRNPAAIAKPPRLHSDDEDDVQPYTVAEVQQLLATARHRRNGARWAIALALGLRQGEALGLRWSDIDLTSGTLIVRRSRQRPRYAHGCGDTCGRARGGYCPQRIALRGATSDTKSRAGRRAIGLPDPIVALLVEHQRAQHAERIHAGQLWAGGDWVFTTHTGQPLNPRTDYGEWKRLLREAGLRDARLHDARHTAATVLLLLGVPDRTVMGIMGWSTTAMTVRYQHLTTAIRRDVATRVAGLLWDGDQPGDGTERTTK